MVVEGNNNDYGRLLLLPHLLAFFAMPWTQTVGYKIAELTAVFPQLSDFNFEHSGAHFDLIFFAVNLFFILFQWKGPVALSYLVFFSAAVLHGVSSIVFCCCSVQAAVMAVTQSLLASRPRSEEWMILRSVLHKT